MQPCSWFMGLPGDSITTCCRSKETRDEIFRMTLGPDESLGDYEVRFQLNYKRANYTLDPKSLKLILLRGISEQMIETLNILSGGDIYQQPYEKIKNFFQNHSRAFRKKG